jgi:arylsulfatase A-like enzyme
VHRDITPQQLDFVVAQYDGEIRCTDDMLGRLLKLLRDLELWEETVVILTSDHGEEFFEHGTKGHKNNLHVESLHVPLVVKPPGRVAPRRDDRLVSLIDLFPTVLDFSKVDTNQLFHGRSVMDPPPESPRSIFFHLVSTWYLPGETRPWKSDTWHAVRHSGYKLIGADGKGRWKLFDVRTDPKEFHGLSLAQPAKTEQLRILLNEHVSQMTRVADARGTPELGQFTTEHIKRLESLGYVGGSGAGDQADSSEDGSVRK